MRFPLRRGSRPVVVVTSIVTDSGKESFFAEERSEGLESAAMVRNLDDLHRDESPPVCIEQIKHGVCLVEGARGGFTTKRNKRDVMSSEGGGCMTQEGFTPEHNAQIQIQYVVL